MIIGVSLELGTTWRGQTEAFSNVWHYDTPPAMSAEELADLVVSTSRTTLFGSGVTFRRVRAWGPTDQGKLASEMLVDKQLSGLGETAYPQPVVGGPKEMSVVAQFNTGRKDIRGNPIFLRKYLHTVNFSGTIEEAMGNAPLSEQFKTLIRNGMEGMKDLGTLTESAAQICDSQGRRLPLNTPCEVLPYAHVRQFRR